MQVETRDQAKFSDSQQARLNWSPAIKFMAIMDQDKDKDSLSRDARLNVEPEFFKKFNEPVF